MTMLPHDVWWNSNVLSVERFPIREVAGELCLCFDHNIEWHRKQYSHLESEHARWGVFQGNFYLEDFSSKEEADRYAEAMTELSKEK